SGDRVQSPTWTPSRAAANAASTPAWPAPMTMTSTERIGCRVAPLLADAEPLEDVRQHIVRRAAAGDLLERGARVLQVDEHEFLGQRVGGGRNGRSRTLERLPDPLQECRVPCVRDCRRVA